MARPSITLRPEISMRASKQAGEMPITKSESPVKTGRVRNLLATRSRAATAARMAPLGTGTKTASAASLSLQTEMRAQARRLLGFVSSARIWPIVCYAIAP